MRERRQEMCNEFTAWGKAEWFVLFGEGGDSGMAGTTVSGEQFAVITRRDVQLNLTIKREALEKCKHLS